MLQEKQPRNNVPLPLDHDIDTPMTGIFHRDTLWQKLVERHHMQER